jgi:hypothetical protein
LIVAIKAESASIVRECIGDGYGRFNSGMKRGCDASSDSVVALRAELPDVKLIAALPFFTQWSLGS